MLQISIHAPLVGSDRVLKLRRGRYPDFNPRSPCGERPRSQAYGSSLPHFNPRSPCGERHYWVTHYVNGLPISIHAPLAGSDHARPVDAPFQPVFQSTLPLRGATVVAAELGTCYQFQSTLPLRGATLASKLLRISVAISIHAPLTGSDVLCSSKVAKVCHFNPRSPCGERQSSLPMSAANTLFQSTLPLRGATG